MTPTMIQVSGRKTSAVAALLFSYCALATVAWPADAYRILAYEPIPGHSHWNVMAAVLQSLLDAGHKVVCATTHRAVGRMVGHPNYTHVDVSPTAGVTADSTADTVARDKSFQLVMTNFRSKAFMIGEGTSRARRRCAQLSDVPEIRNLLDGRERFDAVVMESLFSECQSAVLPERLRVPVAYVVPCPPVNWLPVATGAPYHVAYMGGLLTTSPTPRSFVQRLTNAADHAYTNAIRWYRDGAGARDDGADERRDAAAVVFVNTHHPVEPARPLGPNVVQIGGIHLRDPPKPLPPELARVLDDNDEFGVIIFTFGSVVAINSLPETTLNALKHAFSQIPQTVLWKYENDFMSDKPKNVVLYKWLPQREMLRHPNVRLFISHGGMSGLHEVVDAGVPVLGVPLFFDQWRNIQSLVDVGMALSLDINKMTETIIVSAIKQLLTDRNFSENAKRVSSVFWDRPMTPTDSVVYWTEFLIRHGNMANVRPSMADSSWTTHFMVDLGIALVMAVFALWFCTQVIACKLLNTLDKIRKKHIKKILEKST